MKITANLFHENQTKLQGLTESPAQTIFFFGVYWKKLMPYYIPCIRSTLEDSHSICLKSLSQFFFKSKQLITSQLNSLLEAL